jgi:GNAT superfamily N-acetyltransferase
MTEWRRGAFTISTETRYLEVEAIHQFLTHDAYWALGRSLEQVKTSIDNSAWCFGVYSGEPGEPSSRQVGFARLVSDKVAFGWLCDVFVLPSARGQGLGKWLVEVVVETARASGLRRVVLATRDAAELYRAYGFQVLAQPERWMALLAE